MASKSSDRLVGRILGVRRPRRFLAAVFVVVAVAGAIQLAEAAPCPHGGCPAVPPRKPLGRRA
ncbi:hypothetical protein N602_11170 [Mycobacterium avium subsp. hominissuis 10-5606]|nr:hypothetical protein N602_11170 [Mycobacterium avium subsp. hominissuis 10-5606]